MKGKVYLVGAGPGDPGLITVRGAEVLGNADLVLYDALANARLLELAPEGAKCILVGKRHGKVSVPQPEIERMLVEAAQAGSCVVRLKGGDPFIFGRGGEEAQACRAAGVDFEVVPGVTSAIAAPAYAGIPLTHRDHASTVTFVTGQPGEGRDTADLDWPMLARAGGTLVFLMAALKVEAVADSLLAAGMTADTPAAGVRWGTTPRQSSVRTTLGSLAERCRALRLRPPLVLVIGGVAALADQIAWYEHLPLFGRRIIVTRARAQAGELSRRLERAGAEVLEVPTIMIEPPSSLAPLHAALSRLGSYDWVVWTSVNGVERFFAEMRACGCDIRALAGCRLAAIGPATRDALERLGLRVDVQPTEYRAEALLESLGDPTGKRVLIARAEVAREVLPDTLREGGASVDVVAVYRGVAPEQLSILDGLDGVDMLTFTSSSTVTNFVAVGGKRAQALLKRGKTAAIGPITARTIEEAGGAVDVMPTEYTIPALAEAIATYFAKRHRLK